VTETWDLRCFPLSRTEEKTLPDGWEPLAALPHPRDPDSVLVVTRRLTVGVPDYPPEEERR